jgi:hypothetical protein
MTTALMENTALISGYNILPVYAISLLLIWWYRESKAQDFIDEMQRFHGFLPIERAFLPPVKVAILDTGFHIGEKTWMLYDERIKEARSWLGATPENIVLPGGNDPDGHGTHCATAFLKCASESCELFVAQVFDSRPSRDITGIDATDRVAQVGASNA